MPCILPPSIFTDIFANSESLRGLKGRCVWICAKYSCKFETLRLNNPVWCIVYAAAGSTLTETSACTAMKGTIAAFDGKAVRV